MRLKKREVTDKKVLGEILEECDVVRIGAVDEEGMFIVPVNFGYDFDTGEETTRLVLYFHGAAEGRKAEAFALNPDVAVEMDCCPELITGNYTCSYSYAYRSIMGKGRVSRITSDEEKHMLFPGSWSMRLRMQTLFSAEKCWREQRCSESMSYISPAKSGRRRDDNRFLFRAVNFAQRDESIHVLR